MAHKLPDTNIFQGMKTWMLGNTKWMGISHFNIVTLQFLSHALNEAKKLQKYRMALDIPGIPISETPGDMEIYRWLNPWVSEVQDLQSWQEVSGSGDGSGGSSEDQWNHKGIGLSNP